MHGKLAHLPCIAQALKLAPMEAPAPEAAPLMLPGEDEAPAPEDLQGERQRRLPLRAWPY